MLSRRVHVATRIVLFFILVSTAAWSAPPAAKEKKSSFRAEYIPKSTVAAIMLRPRRFVESRTIQRLLTELEKVGFRKHLEADFRESLGDYNPAEVDQISVLLDAEAIQKIVKARTNPPAPPKKLETDGFDDSDLDYPVGTVQTRRYTRVSSLPFSLIFRLRKPFERKAFIDRNFTERYWETVTYPSGRVVHKEKVLARPETRKLSGQTCYFLNGVVAAFADDNTFLRGSEQQVKAMLSAKAMNAPIAKRIHQLAPADVAISVEMARLSKLMETVRNANSNPKLKTPLDLASKLVSATVTLNASGDRTAILALTMDSKESAVKGRTYITATALPMMKSVLPAAKRLFAETYSESLQMLLREDFTVAKGNIVESLALIRYASTAIDAAKNGLSVSGKENHIIISLRRPKTIDAVPGDIARSLRPIVKQLAERKRKKLRRKNLKAIGVAMHNYHDRYGNFPAADSAGYAKDRKGTIAHVGLSWRVHLLPYLGQRGLYKQFRLNEPWDSKHNRKLIAKMPTVYAVPGVKKKGHTSVHVFVGKGTPFAGKRGPRMRDFLDGTSNTLIAVEAGTDTAVPWTKPGGLPFDVKGDPWRLLGNTPKPGFLGLMTDGSVHRFGKKVDAKILRRLIQPADRGEIPNLPDFKPFRPGDPGGDSKVKPRR